MNPSRSLVIAAAVMGVAMAASVTPSGAAGLQLTQADIPPAAPVTADQKARIRAELQDFSPDDLNALAPNVQATIGDAINREESLPAARQAYLLEQVRGVIADWNAAHPPAERAEREPLVQLLTRIAAVGVAVDLIVPAVQQVREAAARNSSSPVASGDHAPQAIIIEHHH
jgi:hypothetical protein